jgi:hypothetical protein
LGEMVDGAVKIGDHLDPHVVAALSFSR